MFIYKDADLFCSSGKGERSDADNTGSIHPNCQHKVRQRDLVRQHMNFKYSAAGLEGVSAVKGGK